MSFGEDMTRREKETPYHKYLNSWVELYVSNIKVYGKLSSIDEINALFTFDPTLDSVQLSQGLPSRLTIKKGPVTVFYNGLPFSKIQIFPP